MPSSDYPRLPGDRCVRDRYHVVHQGLTQAIGRFHGVEEVKGSIPFSSTPKLLLRQGFSLFSGPACRLVAGTLIITAARTDLS